MSKAVLPVLVAVLLKDRADERDAADELDAAVLDELGAAGLMRTRMRRNA